MWTVRKKISDGFAIGQVERASKFLDRLKGLLGRRELPSGHGLWIDKCNSIHTFFMQFPIDAVFVSSEYRVVRMIENIQPFRLVPVIWNARYVLELPAGSLQHACLRVGEELVLERLEGSS